MAMQSLARIMAFHRLTRSLMRSLMLQSYVLCTVILFTGETRKGSIWPHFAGITKMCALEICSQCVLLFFFSLIAPNVHFLRPKPLPGRLHAGTAPPPNVRVTAFSIFLLQTMKRAV